MLDANLKNCGRTDGEKELRNWRMILQRMPWWVSSKVSVCTCGLVFVSMHVR